MKTIKVRDVYICHNFYTGKYYEYSPRPIYVISNTAAEAELITEKNLKEIEIYFRSKRTYGGKLLIRKSDKKILSKFDIGLINPKSILCNGFAFNSSGKLIKVTRIENSDTEYTTG